MNNPPVVDNSQDNKTTNNGRRLFWKIIIASLVLLICATTLTVSAVSVVVLLGLGTGVQSTGILLPPIPTAEPYNQIAFIGDDDNLWVMAPNGTRKRQLTNDGQSYRLPAWSPDNKNIAFIGTDAESGDTALFSTPVLHGQPTVLYSDTASPPFYLYWSPDSQSVTFLSQENSDMTLQQVYLNRPHRAKTLEEGAPFYWAWSPRGDKLLMHVGGDSKKSHISFLRNERGATLETLEDIDPGRFQSPVWSPDGSHIFYAVADGERKSILYKQKIGASEPVEIARFKGPAHFILSPDGQNMVYVQTERRNEPPFGMAYLITADGGTERLLTDTPVSSAYWSPNGRKVALLTMGVLTSDDQRASGKLAGGLAAQPPQETVHRWWVYDLDKNELDVLKSFNASEDFSTTIPYFDQYHLSLTFWSPDSRYFLISETDPDKKHGLIWLIDSTFENDPEQIAEGTMAVWSWR
ncbi:hypothetical protein QUF63_17100 [Anaerolineales bacterium HSG25]|nr:hypothetical protein [Anaerolineales bacterium HSG25]